MKTEQEEAKPTLPEKIGAVNYAGFFDFSEKGMYDLSVINTMDYPNAEQIADEIARRYNEFPSLKSQLQQLQEEKAKSDSEVKTLREALKSIQELNVITTLSSDISEIRSASEKIYQLIKPFNQKEVNNENRTEGD